jgi:hypothetical protein
MKRSTTLFLLSLLMVACGTRPPKPSECEGPLTPINASAGAFNSGAVHAPGRRS